MNPKFHEALAWLAQVEEYASKEESALRRLARALELKPGYPPALYRRALYLAFQGKFKEAHADSAKLSEDHPQNKSARGVALVVDGPDWEQKFEKETEHYIVRTDVSQEFANDMARQAELIHKLYASRELFKDPIPSTWSKKFPIIIFKDSAEYHETTGMPQGVLGHYAPWLRQLFLFKRDDADATLRVLYHEGFHQFIHPHLADAPIWFDEGMAEYFGACQRVKTPNGGDAMKVRTQDGRLRNAQTVLREMLDKKQVLAWRGFMNMPRGAFMEPKEAPYNYAISWAIVYFCCQYENGQYVDILINYYKALRSGATPEAATEAALHGYDTLTLERRWTDWILQLSPQ
jgi:hypothetical protein